MEEVIIMQTRIWDLREYEDDLYQYPQLDEIKRIMVGGGLVAFPTETVYGLGANARNEDAVKRIYTAKGRPSDNPLIVHIHDVKQLDQFVQYVDERVKVLMNELWPGPISFILPLKTGYLCDNVSGGLNSIAVRMPSHKIGRAFLRIVNEPIAAPSANLSGRPSPTTFEHVYQDLYGKVDGIINGNQSDEGLESTVLDCTQFPFRIARPGAITQEMIETVLPNSIGQSDFNNNEKPIAPGMKYKHYSPVTPVTIIRDLSENITANKSWENVAFIVPESKKQFIPNDAKFIPLCKDVTDVKTANHNLYSILHVLDQNSDIQQAFIFGFKYNSETEAIMNRMLKAAGNNVVEGGEL